MEGWGMETVVQSHFACKCRYKQQKRPSDFKQGHTHKNKKQTYSIYTANIFKQITFKHILPVSVPFETMLIHEVF